MLPITIIPVTAADVGTVLYCGHRAVEVVGDPLTPALSRAQGWRLGGGGGGAGGEEAAQEKLG